MGFKSINSTEKLGDVSLSSGSAPRHTEEGHERCAYYQEGLGARYQGLLCEHNNEATGAYYSEDYVKELKQAIQAVVGVWFAGGPRKEDIVRLQELVSD